MDLNLILRCARAALLCSAGLLLSSAGVVAARVLWLGVDLSLGATLLLVLLTLVFMTVAAIDFWAFWRAVWGRGRT